MTNDKSALPPAGVIHVKVVSPDPHAISAFLQDAVGFAVSLEIEQPGGPDPVMPADTADGLTMPMVKSRRGGDGTGGYLTGDPVETRRFQVFSGSEPRIWATALLCPDLERAHQICIERGHPCTPIGVTPAVSYFYVEVGGITFELLAYPTTTV
ncbi:MAG: hypothetical protein JWQ70_1253 [Aeromicrobium sp.]|nr:hypothetical protein [Aeromicrobium sp.]